jgi:O-antigen/teichoic acid export membrane protein
MKTHSFFKGLSWLIILNLLVKPVWMFFIDRQVQNLVGHEEYGKYFALLNLSYVLFFLSDAGLSNMINQRIAKGEQLNVPYLLRFKAILVLVYFITACFVGWLTHITHWDWLFYILFVQILTSVFVLLRNIITAHQFFSADAVFSILDKTLMTVICGAIIYTAAFGSMSLLLFLQVQTVCTAVAVIIATIFLLNKGLLFKSGREKIPSVIRFMVPFAVIILLMSVHYRLDGFLLERIHLDGALQAGIYASAYRLLDAGNMVGYLAASFLVPFVANHKEDALTIDNAVLITRHGLMLFAIGIASFTIVFAPWIQQILYHSNNEFNIEVMQWCIAAIPGYFLVHIYGSVLTATGRFNDFISILLVSVTINIILNILLIPSKGAMGCCIAAVTSQYVCGILSSVVTTRKFHLKVHYASLGIYLLVAGLLTGFFYFAKSAGFNVWIVAAIAALLTLSVLIVQVRKNYFVSLR